MHNFKVKVCGITREKDALSAVKYGADMLGFIFYRKSPRYISVSNAKEIINLIPPTIFRVGVFVNEDKNKALNIAQKLSLDFVQLSGNENKSEISFFKRHGIKVIKTIAVSTVKDVSVSTKSNADIIHFDCADTKLYGGTGKQFDWNIKIPKNLGNLMLAGGINSANVVEGIKKFKPLIVDVNSGVEFKPGYKSDSKLKEFFSKVNRL